jgi:hypothetical protein
MIIDDKKKTKKNFGRDKSAAIQKGKQRDAAFKKQCQAYKKANPNEKSCKNMNFKNSVNMDDSEKKLYAMSKGNLTESGKSEKQ